MTQTKLQTKFKMIRQIENPTHQLIKDQSNGPFGLRGNRVKLA